MEFLIIFNIYIFFVAIKEYLIEEVEQDSNRVSRTEELNLRSRGVNADDEGQEVRQGGDSYGRTNIHQNPGNSMVFSMHFGLISKTNTCPVSSCSDPYS